MHGNGEYIHLALSPWDLTDKYNQHAGVTMNSFLKNCSHPVVVHMLYDETLSSKNIIATEENKQKYQIIADKYGAKIEYHHVELPEWIVNIDNVRNRWTPGSLLRLCIQDLLSDVNKVIYLDCDTVVNTNINKLWEEDIGNSLVAAVQECRGYDTKKFKKYCKRVNLNYSPYFNSGVLIFNLKMMKEQGINLSETTFDFLKRHPYAMFPDMDALNYLFQNKCYYLNPKYNNYIKLPESEDRYSDCILHSLSLKPWKIYVNKLSNLYWDNLLETPWNKNIASAARDATSVTTALKITKEYMFFGGGFKIGATRVLQINKSFIVGCLRGLKIRLFG